MRQNLIDKINRFCILCFLAGFPLLANLSLAADSVKRALSDLGPAPLATIPLDTFRGTFILPGEVNNVLEPMEHALERKRGLVNYIFITLLSIYHQDLGFKSSSPPSSGVVETVGIGPFVVVMGNAKVKSIVSQKIVEPA